MLILAVPLLLSLALARRSGWSDDVEAEILLEEGSRAERSSTSARAIDAATPTPMSALASVIAAARRTASRRRLAAEPVMGISSQAPGSAYAAPKCSVRNRRQPKAMPAVRPRVGACGPSDWARHWASYRRGRRRMSGWRSAAVTGSAGFILLAGERLGNVTSAPPSSPRDTVLDLPAGRQHRDQGSHGEAQPPAHLDSIHLRQAKIE